MALVKIIYYRNQDVDNVKTAVVKDTQAQDIKRLLPHIHITAIAPAPIGAIRDYILY